MLFCDPNPLQLKEGPAGGVLPGPHRYLPLEVSVMVVSSVMFSPDGVAPFSPAAAATLAVFFVG